VVDEPAVQRVVVDAVMDARVVEHDYGGSAIALPDQRVEKLDHVGTFYRRGARGVDKTVLAKVKCANNAAFAMAVGLDTVGQATW